MESSARREWEAWRTVVDKLKATGAVTEADCKAQIGMAASPGLELFDAIRAWGEALAVLVRHSDRP